MPKAHYGLPPSPLDHAIFIVFLLDSVISRKIVSMIIMLVAGIINR